MGKRKKACPFDGKPCSEASKCKGMVCPFDGESCPHEAGCEAVYFDVEGHEEVLFRCNRLPIDEEG